MLGVSVFQQDWGPACVSSGSPGFYYACTSSTCTQASLALVQQVQNPVTFFTADNNGVIIQLPSVSPQGHASVTGAIVFGVDTQNNNRSSAADTVLKLDPTTGDLTTSVGNQSYPSSFFDTGSNGLYFNDASLTKCSSSTSKGFYCPASTQNFTATVVGLNNASRTIAFSVGNADSLGAGNPALVAFPTLAGTNSNAASFDWGLPFYYGRNVYSVLEARSSSAGTGPYIAF
jgi:hypothetical protein